MHNENYSIIFSSLTGNTRKLADKIHEILPKESCDYFGTADAQGIESELLYIGFWTDKGNADSDTLDFLSKLKNKKIFLFGTAGFGGSDAYFQRILGNVKSAIDSSNTIVGEYMCQGKMPQSVRERYVKMKENPDVIGIRNSCACRGCRLNGTKIIFCKCRKCLQNFPKT